VLIHIQPDARGVTIRFTDDGPGIPEEIRSKIFSPSFTTKQGGSGLGLAISKQGIELCLGAIRFETTVGAGTTFEIFLPAGEAGAIGP
jgi:signal transduction histidine kinase